MKKLFMIVALSLVMVACNKDEERELSYWDKIAAEMGTTKLSARDVLASLSENEYWNIVTEYCYFENNGKIEEEDYSGPMPGKGQSTYRFNENICTQYSLHNSTGQTQLDRVDYTIKGDDLNFIFSYKDNDIYEWKIIAYDEKQVLVEIHNLNTAGIDNSKKLLYRKILLVRTVDDTKWWEEAK